MYRSGERHREFGVRAGRYTGAAITIATKDLPHDTREQLSACLLGRGPVKPIASWGPPRGSRRAAFVVLVVALLTLVRVADEGFGDPSNANAIQPRWVALVYAGALAAIVLSARALVRTISREGWVPLPLGRHLLPLDLIEVRPGTITIRPFGEARDVRVDEDARRVRILYADSALEELALGPPAKNEPSLWVRMLNAQHDLEEAAQAGRAKADPFEALRDEDGFAESFRKRAVEPAPLPTSGSLAIVPAVIALSVAVGVGIVLARNAASDDAMYAKARATKATATYHRYLEVGGTRHASEVRTSLLPRAALDEAEAHGTIHTLRAFLRDYPRSSVDAEARTHFDAACRVELDAATTLEALRIFEESAADCDLGTEIAAARAKLHEGLLSKARSGGIASIREYLRRYPNSPVRDGALAALRSAFEDARAKIRDGVGRPEVRDALLELAARSESENVPVTLFVPMTLQLEPDPPSATTRNVVAAFDRAITSVLDPAIAYVYHPTSLANVDAERGTVLRVDARHRDEDWKLHVRFELTSGTRTAKWSATRDDEDDSAIGAFIARVAISSQSK